MNPANLFAMQTLRVPSFEGARGGVPSMTPDLASLYCKGMKRHHYLAARLRWGLDYSNNKELEDKLWRTSMDVLWPKNNWQIRKYKKKEINKDYRPHMIRDMCMLAILEMGEAKKITDTLRASFLDIDKSRYSRKWKGIYEDVYEELNDWTNQAYRHVKQMQAKDETDN